MNVEMRYVKVRDLDPDFHKQFANQKKIVEVVDGHIISFYPINGVNDIYSSKYRDAYRDFVNARGDRVSAIIFLSCVLLECIGGFAAGFFLFIKSHSLSHGCVTLFFLTLCFLFLWSLTKITMQK